VTTPAYDFERVAEDLISVAADVRLGDVFGARCIEAAGTAFAALDEPTGGMAFKLAEEADRDAALALDGAGPWDPKGTGRPLRDWVLVPHGGARSWADLARRAVAPYV
jgi:hypothetical protein